MCQKHRCFSFGCNSYLCHKSHCKKKKKKIQSENSNLAPFTPIKSMLNELFPAFDNNPRVWESVFTFVREIKLVLHYCTLKKKKKEAFAILPEMRTWFHTGFLISRHLGFIYTIPSLPPPFFLIPFFSLWAWTQRRRDWTKIKNIAKWLM